MIEVRELTAADFARAAAALPLHRFDPRSAGTYLVAWDADAPVGHVHVAWSGTELGIPELQDMYVLAARRGEGLGTLLAAAAEGAIAARGNKRCSLSVSETNEDARRLYERLGYARADVPPKWVRGTVQVRDGTLEIDDVLLYFAKDVDFSSGPSS